MNKYYTIQNLNDLTIATYKERTITAELPKNIVHLRYMIIAHTRPCNLHAYLDASVHSHTTPNMFINVRTIPFLQAFVHFLCQ